MCGYFPVKFSVQRTFPTNWRKLSNTILCSPNFSHKLTGIIQRYSLFTEFFPQTAGNYPTLFFVHRMFPTNCRELSNAFFCSPNVSHKLTGIIQSYSLFTKFFPQTAGNYPTLFFVHRMFPTNCRELSNAFLCSPNVSHKLTGYFRSGYQGCSIQIRIRTQNKMNADPEPNPVRKKGMIQIHRPARFYNFTIFFSFCFAGIQISIKISSKSNILLTNLQYLLELNIPHLLDYK